MRFPGEPAEDIQRHVAGPEVFLIFTDLIFKGFDFFPGFHRIAHTADEHAVFTHFF
ncbi:hypothetical protein SDC9_165198 [bioreactor metagenome]|uniref:Uncharacterized protein n=1 Tax=bioreactor metagenome TaxID=1076179 RepID=A0A645G0Y3_9ZZZZ